MSVQQAFRLSLCGAAAALLLLAGCDGSPQSNAFPMAEISRFDQPPPKQPLFGSDQYLRSHDVMPPSKPDLGEPLPPAVPLTVVQANIEVIQPDASTGEAAETQGGANPASGMAQGITSAQGDGEKNQLDGGKSQ